MLFHSVSHAFLLFPLMSANEYARLNVGNVHRHVQTHTQTHDFFVCFVWFGRRRRKCNLKENGEHRREIHISNRCESETGRDDELAKIV